MNSEENDPVWKLIGKAKRRPDVSPTFAENVARQVRQIGAPRAGVGARILAFFSPRSEDHSWARPAAALGALAAIAIAAIVIFNGSVVDPETNPPISKGDPASVPELSDPLLDVFEEEMEQIDQFDALLTVNDVDDLADEEIAMLLF